MEFGTSSPLASRPQSTETDTTTNPVSTVDTTQSATQASANPVAAETVSATVAEPAAPQYTDGYDFTSLGSFGKAFAAARKAGLKTFTYKGALKGTGMASTPEQVAN